MTLLPGSGKDLIACNLRQAYQVENSDNEPSARIPNYEALSYAWGEASKTRSICLDGFQYSVTENLGHALHYLRDRQRQRTLWIDAICINQSDDTEKRQQVGSMHQIFANAQLVIVWLGKPSVDSDLAMSFVKMIHDCFNPPVDPDEEEQNIDWIGSFGQARVGSELIRPNYSHSWVAFHRLLNRSWWSRAWVMQELLVAKRVVICCGHASASWMAFRVAIPVTRMANSEIVSCIVDGTSCLISSISELYSLPIHLIEPAFRLVARKVARSEIGTRDIQRAEGLTHWLSGTRHRACKVAHDKIYSVLGLAGGQFREAILPDYSQPIETLFAQTARIYIETSGCLDIISHSQHSKGQQNMPSWVPDWGRHERATSFAEVAVTNCHQASGTTVAAASFSSDTLMLLAKGICMGIVADRQIEVHLLPDLTKEKKQHTASGEIIDGSEDYDTVYWHFVRSAEVLLYPAMELLSPEDPLWADHLDLFLRAFQIQRRHGKIVLGDNFDRRRPHLESWAHLTEQQICPHFPRFYDHLQGLLTSRTIISTEDGRLGIAPDFTEAGDLVCVLFGCHSPVVLRKIDGLFFFVGDCWMYQMMDGEAIQMLNEGMIQEDQFTIV